LAEAVLLLGICLSRPFSGDYARLGWVAYRSSKEELWSLLMRVFYKSDIGGEYAVFFAELVKKYCCHLIK